MVSLFLLAALVQGAAPMVADQPIVSAASAFRLCLEAKAKVAPASISAEAAADRVLAQCEADRARLEQLFEGMIVAAPAAQKAAARDQFRNGMAEGRQGLIEAIAAARKATPAK